MCAETLIQQIKIDLKPKVQKNSRPELRYTNYENNPLGLMPTGVSQRQKEGRQIFPSSQPFAHKSFSEMYFEIKT